MKMRSSAGLFLSVIFDQQRDMRRHLNRHAADIYPRDILSAEEVIGRNSKSL